MWPFRQKLTKEELKQIQQLQDIESVFLFVAREVANNTALVPKGKMFASQLEATLKLISNRKNGYLSSLLAKRGIPKAQVNLTSGAIRPLPADLPPQAAYNAQPHVPGNHTKAPQE